MRDPLLNWSEALIWVRATPAGDIVETSRSFAGAAGEESAGRSLTEIVPASYHEELFALLRGATASGSHTGRLPLTGNGRGEAVEQRVLALADDAGALLVAEPPLEDMQRLLKRTMEMNANLMQLRTQLQHANERLRLLESVGAVGLAHRDLQTVLDELLRLMCHMLDGDDATILLLDEDRQVLRVEASLGRVEEVGFEVPVGVGVSGGVTVTGRPAIVEDLGAGRVHSPSLAARGGSMLAVPLRAGGRLIGVANVSSARLARFDTADARLLQLVADRAALAIDNVRAYERERRSSLALQRSLLPEALPDVPGIELAARYVPAGEATEVGGDWFDALPLPGGRVGLAIGDVAGRGLNAATAMGRLSNTLHAYALEHRSPSAVLERVNRFAYDEELIATAAYLVLDPGTGEGLYASSGHLPPIVTSGGRAQLLPRAGAPPLGTELRPVPERPFELRRGASLVLYTDGLVEDRREEIDFGIERLRSAAERSDLHPEALAEELLRLLVGDREGEDDVAIVVARRG